VSTIVRVGYGDAWKSGEDVNVVFGEIETREMM
jgi:hypothetical protein